MSQEPRIVWTVYESRSCPPEEAADPSVELFVPVPAEPDRFETRSEALQAALDLLTSEDWEIGVLIWPADPPKPWQVLVLEPASFLERRQVCSEDLPGFRWVRSRPPRSERDRALHEVQELWNSREGQRAYALEQESLSPGDLTRITLEFRERGIS